MDHLRPVNWIHIHLVIRHIIAEVLDAHPRLDSAGKLLKEQVRYAITDYPRKAVEDLEFQHFTRCILNSYGPDKRRIIRLRHREIIDFRG